MAVILQLLSDVSVLPLTFIPQSRPSSTCVPHPILGQSSVKNNLQSCFNGAPPSRRLSLAVNPSRSRIRRRQQIAAVSRVSIEVLSMASHSSRYFTMSPKTPFSTSLMDLESPSTLNSNLVPASILSSV